MHLDTTQQEIAGALKDNTVLLAEVSPSSMCWGGRGPHPVPPAPAGGGGGRHHGRGMTEEMRRTALQPFVTSRSDGTGLGLASVAAIVSGWNGTIELFSAPGEGTSVNIRIPTQGETHE